MWAHRCMGQKNGLTAIDAQRVEQAFQAKLTALMSLNAEPASQDAISAASVRSPAEQSNAGATRNGIDKGVLALPEPRRIRDREHIKFVAQQSCLICGRRPSDAHHLRFAQSHALGRKVSDEFTVPLCRGHHREVHHRGDEASWWARAGIDPTAAARILWLKTHPLPETSTAKRPSRAVLVDEFDAAAFQGALGSQNLW
jgi:hypothetical protein